MVQSAANVELTAKFLLSLTHTGQFIAELAIQDIKEESVKTWIRKPQRQLPEIEKEPAEIDS